MLGPTPGTDLAALKNQAPALAGVGARAPKVACGWDVLRVIGGSWCAAGRAPESQLYSSVAGDLGQVSFLTYKMGIRISISEGCSTG